MQKYGGQPPPQPGMVTMQPQMQHHDNAAYIGPQIQQQQQQQPAQGGPQPGYNSTLSVHQQPFVPAPGQALLPHRQGIQGGMVTEQPIILADPRAMSLRRTVRRPGDHPSVSVGAGAGASARPTEGYSIPPLPGYQPTAYSNSRRDPAAGVGGPVPQSMVWVPRNGNQHGQGNLLHHQEEDDEDSPYSLPPSYNQVFGGQRQDPRTTGTSVSRIFDTAEVDDTTSTLMYIKNGRVISPEAGFYLPLPEGWEVKRDHTTAMKPVFIDHHNRVINSCDPRPLPPDWEQMLTSDGIAYFVDHKAKKSFWTHPCSYKLPGAHWQIMYDTNDNPYFIDHKERKNYTNVPEEAYEDNDVPGGRSKEHFDDDAVSDTRTVYAVSELAGNQVYMQPGVDPMQQQMQQQQTQQMQMQQQQQTQQQQMQMQQQTQQQQMQMQQQMQQQQQQQMQMQMQQPAGYDANGQPIYPPHQMHSQRPHSQHPHQQYAGQQPPHPQLEPTGQPGYPPMHTHTQIVDPAAQQHQYLHQPAGQMHQHQGQPERPHLSQQQQQQQQQPIGYGQAGQPLNPGAMHDSSMQPPDQAPMSPPPSYPMDPARQQAPQSVDHALVNAQHVAAAAQSGSSAGVLPDAYKTPLAMGGQQPADPGSHSAQTQRPVKADPPLALPPKGSSVSGGFSPPPPVHAPLDIGHVTHGAPSRQNTGLQPDMLGVYKVGWFQLGDPTGTRHSEQKYFELHGQEVQYFNSNMEAHPLGLQKFMDSDVSCGVLERGAASDNAGVDPSSLFIKITHPGQSDPLFIMHGPVEGVREWYDAIQTLKKLATA